MEMPSDLLLSNSPSTGGCGGGRSACGVGVKYGGGVLGVLVARGERE